MAGWFGLTWLGLVGWLSGLAWHLSTKRKSNTPEVWTFRRSHTQLEWVTGGRGRKSVDKGKDSGGDGGGEPPVSGGAGVRGGTDRHPSKSCLDSSP